MISDIYFEDDFGSLYEKIEDGKLVCFKYQDKEGLIKHNFIMRDIPNKKGYKDIITPYGYGGPVIAKLDGEKNVLVKNFENSFKKYVQEQKIVSEFIRFHPLEKNQRDFSEIYHPEKIRNTVKTKIEVGTTIEQQFSKSTKKQINKLLRNGYYYRVTEQPNDLDEFMKIYFSTMKRTKATSFYYFDETYFKNLLELFSEHTLLIEILNPMHKVVSSGLYLYYNHYLHAHLSGTLSDYIVDSPAYLIKYCAVNWAEKNNIKYLFHGGGTSNKENDGVYLFKKKFAKNTEDDSFYIGKKIWNSDVYDELCLSKDRETEFFPLYRK